MQGKRKAMVDQSHSYSREPCPAHASPPTKQTEYKLTDTSNIIMYVRTVYNVRTNHCIQCGNHVPLSVGN